MHDEVSKLKHELVELKAKMYDAIQVNQQLNDTINFLVNNLKMILNVDTEEGQDIIGDIITEVSKLKASLESPVDPD
jgi:hypothetical protein